MVSFWFLDGGGVLPPGVFVRADSKGVTGGVFVRADSKGLMATRCAALAPTWGKKAERKGVRARGKGGKAGSQELVRCGRREFTVHDSVSYSICQPISAVCLVFV